MNKIDKIKNTIRNMVESVIRESKVINLFMSYTEKCVNQILFELIKEEFIDRDSKESKSLKGNFNENYCFDDSKDIDNILRALSRQMGYTKYYKNNLKDKIKSEYGFVPQELNREDIFGDKENLEGYKLSRYDFDQIVVMKSLKILTNIVNRRIVKTKSFSNNDLEDELNNYKKFFVNKKGTSDSYEYVKNSMLLFTTEIKYNIETVYRIADRLSCYNNSKSKNRFLDTDIDDMANYFIRPHSYNGYGLKENSLVLMKIEEIQNICPNNVQQTTSEYGNLMNICYVAKLMIKSQNSIDEYLKSLTYDEMKDFIDHNYNIWEILDKEYFFENKKEKHMREIYDRILGDIPPYKKK